MLRLTELEESLTADNGAELRNSLCEQLLQEARISKQRLDRGLNPNQYQQEQLKLEALVAAADLVNTQVFFQKEQP